MGAGRAQFWAPDALLAQCREGDVSAVGWLLVDEAAAIPAPLLQQRSVISRACC